MRVKVSARTGKGTVVSSPVGRKVGIGDQKEPTRGGINLNPELLDLQIKRDGNGVPLPMEMSFDFAQDKQPVGDMHIDGFIPIIINVTPVSLPMLLGLSPKTSDPGDDADTASRAYPHPQAVFLKEEWFTTLGKEYICPA